MNLQMNISSCFRNITYLWGWLSYAYLFQHFQYNLYVNNQ